MRYNSPSLFINGYEIKLADTDDANSYKLKDLPEELCLKLTTKIDQGERYSPDSRYIYITKFDKYHDVQCGTAKAAVQRLIIDLFKPKDGNICIVINKTQQ